MKLTLAEPRLLKDSFSIISELVTETRIQITQENLEVIAMDPANVAMVLFKMPKEAFAEYVIEDEEIIAINLSNLKQILRRTKNSDVLTLEKQENKLKIVMKDKSTKTFYLPLLELEDRKQKIPNLDFKAIINLKSSTLSEAIDDVDVVSESVSFSTEDNKFKVSASGDLTKAEVEMPSSEDLTIQTNENHKSKYSTEYLKKMMSGSKISDIATLRFSNDYPLSLEFEEKGKATLAFILAPRVDND